MSSTTLTCPTCGFTVTRSKREAAQHILDQHIGYEQCETYLRAKKGSGLEPRPEEVPPGPSHESQESSSASSPAQLALMRAHRAWGLRYTPGLPRENP